ncbi:MAG: GAF domain-containing protein, partial [Chitinispirillaceae bacterium]|nr:GAF domain-containing protein [Chitinispirillaceae bacterium]
MTPETYPQLIDAATHGTVTVKGRIFTIGASADCHLQIPARGIPAIAAHLLFKDGSYALQSLTEEKPVTLNGAVPAAGQALRHGDRIAVGGVEYIYAEKRLEESTASGGTERDGAIATPSDTALQDLVSAVVALLHDSGESVITGLVSSVSRLMRCDAARLVEEDSATGERKTIERYPAQSGLDRFSNRAIDWAKTASRTVIMHEDEWRDKEASARSLEKNLVASVLCAPLRTDDMVLGYLYLDRLQGNNPFTEQDRLFCDTLLPLFSAILTNYHERKRQRETIARLQEQQVQPSGGMFFECDAMKWLVELATRSARTDSPVLILG